MKVQQRQDNTEQSAYEAPVVPIGQLLHNRREYKCRRQRGLLHYETIDASMADKERAVASRTIWCKYDSQEDCRITKLSRCCTATACATFRTRKWRTPRTKDPSQHIQNKWPVSTGENIQRRRRQQIAALPMKHLCPPCVRGADWTEQHEAKWWLRRTKWPKWPTLPDPVYVRNEKGQCHIGKSNIIYLELTVTTPSFLIMGRPNYGVGTSPARLF